MYRDVLALQGAGRDCARFNDGEIAVALGLGDYVRYINGSGGAPVLVDDNTALVVAKACCGRCLEGGTPTSKKIWGKVKTLYQ